MGPVRLFHYDVKDGNNFLHRNHPINLHPITQEYKDYYSTQWGRIIEGMWINDGGTWVYMFPKLYFYINLMKIQRQEKGKKTRKYLPPDLTTKEFIIFSYLFCCQGFSGFIEDEEITCNYLVEKIENKVELYPFEQLQLDELSTIKKSDGTYKKFIDPWEYLTKFYIKTRPLDRPLGLPLYENPMKNGVLLGNRGGGKTFIAIADLLHEFVTGGVLYKKDFKDIFVNNLLMTVGSSNSDDLAKYFKKAEGCWNTLPGEYKEGDTYSPSPFHRILNSGLGKPWTAPNTAITNTYYDDRNVQRGSSSTIFKAVPTVQNPTAMVGERQRRVQIEEFGFLKNAVSVFNSNVNTTKIEGEVIGFSWMWGTSGKLEHIQEPKEIFTSTVLYDVFGIPNYWENPSKKIGLFLPNYYVESRFRDEHGNQLIEDAYSFWEEHFDKKKKAGASQRSLTEDRAYNPSKPTDMWASSKVNGYPVLYASERKAEIDNFDLFSKKARVGTLDYVRDKFGRIVGAAFTEDLKGKLQPIRRVRLDGYTTLDSGIIIYEMPPVSLPPPSFKRSLFKVVYDPVMENEGTSLASILVYKGLPEYTWDDPNWEEDFNDSIVAEYMGRDVTDVDENHKKACMLALFYGAKVGWESNVKGFDTYCIHNGLQHLLQPRPWRGMGEQRNVEKIAYGIPMNEGTKPLGTALSIQWLNRQWGFDKYGNKLTNAHRIYSERMLEEIENYSDENSSAFDHLSALRLLTIWLKDEEQLPVAETVDKNKEDMYKKVLEMFNKKDVYENLYYG